MDMVTPTLVPETLSLIKTRANGTSGVLHHANLDALLLRLICTFHFVFEPLILFYNHPIMKPKHYNVGFDLQFFFHLPVFLTCTGSPDSPKEHIIISRSPLSSPAFSYPIPHSSYHSMLSHHGPPFAYVCFHPLFTHILAFVFVLLFYNPFLPIFLHFEHPHHPRPPDIYIHLCLSPHVLKEKWRHQKPEQPRRV